MNDCFVYVQCRWYNVCVHLSYVTITLWNVVSPASMVIKSNDSLGHCVCGDIMVFLRP